MEKYDQILTAKAWIIMNYKTGAYMRGCNFQTKRQIASLTKMYTLYACLQINKQLNINTQKTYIKVIELCTNRTLADLKPDKFIKLKDLYYGMMLPSGNDAATLLSCYYGYWLDKQSIFPNLIFNKVRKVDLKDRVKYSNLFIKRFIRYINEKIIKQELQHKKTKMQNPHGLNNKFQVSTARQVAQAGIHFMKNSNEFREIVRTKKYASDYLNEQDDKVEQNSFSWQNTNILLKQEGFQGIKTGQTTSAGNCLVSLKSVQIKKIVVLGCITPQKRFQETKILCKDLQKHLQQITY